VLAYHEPFEPVRAPAMTWVTLGGRRSAVYRYQMTRSAPRVGLECPSWGIGH